MSKPAITRMLALPVAASVLALAGCGGDVEHASEEVEQTNNTLASAIAAKGNLSTMADALIESDLNSVFDGPGAYTVLAPDDDAFAGLGDNAENLMSEEQRPILIALLRSHIVPGQIDLDSVRSAISTTGGPVEMTTLGDGAVTFAMEGDTLTVSGDDGRRTMVEATDMVIASNGVLLPVDGILRSPPPSQ